MGAMAKEHERMRDCSSSMRAQKDDRDAGYHRKVQAGQFQPKDWMAIIAGRNCRSITCLSHADRPTAELTNICTITCSILHCCTSPARKFTLSLFLKHDAPVEFVSIVT